MRNIIVVFLLFFLACLFIKCATKAKCGCSDVNFDSPFDSSTLYKYSLSSKPITLSITESKKNPGNPFFGFTTYIKDDSSIYLTYVTKDRKIVFSNLFDSTNFHVTNFPYEASKEHRALMMISKDTLHILYLYDKTYKQFLIDKDFSVSLIKEMDLQAAVKDKNWYIRSNEYGKQFDYKYPYLLIPYGKRDGLNLYDKKSHLLIDISNLTSKSVMNFPECYSDCFVNSNENCSAVFGNNSIFGLFALYGKFESYDVHNQRTDFVDIPLSSQFVEFDKKELRNLAYSRKFDLLNEKNVDIIPTENGNIVVVKRLKKDSFVEKSQYRYYVYDSNHVLKSIGMFPNPIIPSCRSFKNGFLALNDSLTKIYCYEKS